MKNTVRAVFFQFFVGIFVFFLSLLINFSAPVRGFVYSNIIFRVVLCLVPVYLYFNLGKGMSKKKPKSLDFLTGSIVFVIGLVLGIVALAGLGTNVFNVNVFSSMWRFPLDIFLYPEVYIIEVLGIKQNILTFIVALAFPSIIYGLSIKVSRKKILKAKRRKHMQDMKRKANYR